MQTCRHTLSAYSHWHCQRSRFHLGSHRYRNYIGTWFPRFWKVRDLYRIYDCNQHLSVGRRDGTKPSLMSYRRALFPVAYEPAPHDAEAREPFATSW